MYSESKLVKFCLLVKIKRSKKFESFQQLLNKFQPLFCSNLNELTDHVGAALD